jgi:hypothetical protein
MTALKLCKPALIFPNKKYHQYFWNGNEVDKSEFKWYTWNYLEKNRFFKPGHPFLTRMIGVGHPHSQGRNSGTIPGGSANYGGGNYNWTTPDYNFVNIDVYGDGGGGGGGCGGYTTGAGTEGDPVVYHAGASGGAGAAGGRAFRQFLYGDQLLPTPYSAVSISINGGGAGGAGGGTAAPGGNGGTAGGAAFFAPGVTVFGAGGGGGQGAFFTGSGSEFDPLVPHTGAGGAVGGASGGNIVNTPGGGQPGGAGGAAAPAPFQTAGSGGNGTGGFVATTWG